MAKMLPEIGSCITNAICGGCMAPYWSGSKAGGIGGDYQSHVTGKAVQIFHLILLPEA